MILYSKSEVITPHSNTDAWYSVNIKPKIIHGYKHYEEELAFVWTYMIYEMVRSKRDTHFLTVI